MKQRTRIHYTRTQKALMWERWKAAESLHGIVRLFDRNHSSIQKILPAGLRMLIQEMRAFRCHMKPSTAVSSFWHRGSHIATLVEHRTRYVMQVNIAGKDTETVVNALIKQAKKLPQEFCQSLTWDRGKEMADHKRFTLATDVQVDRPLLAGRKFLKSVAAIGQ